MALVQMPGRSTLIPSSSTSSEDLASNIKERAPPGATLGDVEHQRIPPEKEKEILEDDSFRVVWADKDPENPFNWSWAKKASISFVSIWMTLYVAASAVSYSVAVRGIQQDLEVSRVVALLGITFFTLGFAIAPMVLAPISEVYGRSVLYYTTYGLYTLMFIPQAMAPNITCMLIARFMGGVFGSTGSTMVGGTLADTYHAEDRGAPMAYFSSVTLFGTSLSVVAASFVDVNPRLGWRWIFWIQLILNSAHFVVLLLVLRETRGSVLLSRRAARLRKETGDQRYRAAADVERQSIMTMVRFSLARPFLLLLTEPVVMSFSLWVSFTWGVLYLFLNAIPLAYTRVFGFNEGQAGLAFLGMFVGTVIALALAPTQDRWYNASAKTNGGIARPEARLYTSMGGSVFFAVGLFIFGWTCYPSVHWIVPIIAVGLTSFGIFTVYLAVFNYLADIYGTFASSALAAQSFLRNVFAAAFPLFATQMYEKMGFQWASSLLGFIGVILTAVPWILYFFGPRIRAASKYATGDT